MSENKHTPGPWVWRGKDGGLYQEGTTHRFGDAVLLPSYEYNSGIDTNVSEADMALIAAAPTLLEALKLAIQDVTAFAFNTYHPHGRQILNDRIKQYEAAIRKAEGND